MLHAFEKIGIRFPYSVILISGAILAAGLVLALIESPATNLVAFVTTPDPLTVAVLGIGVSFAGFHFIDSRLNPVVQETGACFDVADEAYDKFVRELNSGWCNAYGSLVSSAVAILSLVALVCLCYPRPVFAGAVEYHVYDWYLFTVYLLVMAIFGSASWALVGFTYFSRKMRRMPIQLDRVRDLQPLIGAALTLVAGWFVASGLVYLVLPLPYAVSAIFLGLLAFVFVQIHLHEAIMLEKRKTRAKLQERYREAQKKFEEPSVDDRQELSEAIMLSTIRGLIRDVDETQEWPINYSQFVTVAISSAIPLVIRYALTRTI